MNIPFFGRFLDERFFERRRRSTGIAGVAGAIAAIVLFEYRYVVDHVWSWDLLAVALTIVAVKVAVMAWYLVKG